MRRGREKEKDGVDYFFVSKEEFQRNIDEDNFLEWAEFVGNRYGTPRNYVESLRSKGVNVFLEIEVNGASETFYADETYQLQVDFPEHYPMEDPQVCSNPLESLFFVSLFSNYFSY